MHWHIGTSGWHYPHWRGLFYPQDLPSRLWLAWYAQRFKSVEVNGSFYRLPSEATLLSWKKATPEGFVFSFKASSFITHRKKLADPLQTLPALLQAVSVLGEKLGPVLFQLPPRWHVNEGRLRAFLQALPPKLQSVFELRDPSWHTQAVFDLLSAHNAACCIFDMQGLESPRVFTADFAYLRFHGVEAPYGGLYGRKRLEGWAKWLVKAPVKKVYAYFDNDENAYATADASTLEELVE